MLWFDEVFSLFSRLLKPRTLIHVGTSWPKLMLTVFDMSLTSRKALKTKTTFQIEYFNFYEIQPKFFGTKLIICIYFIQSEFLRFKKMKPKFCKLIRVQSVQSYYDKKFSIGMLILLMQFHQTIMTKYKNRIEIQ